MLIQRYEATGNSAVAASSDHRGSAASCEIKPFHPQVTPIYAEDDSSPTTEVVRGRSDNSLALLVLASISVGSVSPW